MKNILIPALLTFFVAACSIDSYETGEGEYSLYTAEMVTFPLNAPHIQSGTMDDNRQFNLQQPIDTSKVIKAFSQGIRDGQVRMMLYFRKLQETETAVAGEWGGGQTVFMPTVTLSDTTKRELKTDPITLHSAWKSKNGQFINLFIAAKTGISDNGMQAQLVGLVCDSIRNIAAEKGANTCPTVYLRFIHDQNNVPQYYSSQAYLSVSRQQLQQLVTDNLPTATGKDINVHLTVNTYDGIKAFDF